MANTADIHRSIRVLTIGIQEGNLTEFAALPGIKVIGNAHDCDDGLRQTLMTYPDVIALPWNAPALKLLRALAHLHDERYSPVVVIVTGVATLPDIFTLCEDMALLGAEQLDAQLAERLTALFDQQQDRLLKR
jgi:hypothetical protein